MNTICKLTISIFLLSISLESNSAEDYMCQTYYDKTQRQFKILDSQQASLSTIAKEKLIEELTFNTKQCIAGCEGSKFELCNNVAKKLER